MVPGGWTGEDDHASSIRTPSCGLRLVAGNPDARRAVAGGRRAGSDNSLAAVPLPLSDQYTDRVTDPDRTLGSNRRR
jgi:hypothetical protein